MAAPRASALHRTSLCPGGRQHPGPTYSPKSSCRLAGISALSLHSGTGGGLTAAQNSHCPNKTGCHWPSVFPPLANSRLSKQCPDIYSAAFVQVFVSCFPWYQQRQESFAILKDKIKWKFSPFSGPTPHTPVPRAPVITTPPQCTADNSLQSRLPNSRLRLCALSVSGFFRGTRLAPHHLFPSGNDAGNSVPCMCWTQGLSPHRVTRRVPTHTPAPVLCSVNTRLCAPEQDRTAGVQARSASAEAARYKIF